MGSSYTKYRGHGFWSYDDFLERLVGDVAAMIRERPKPEQWLADLASHWELQSSGNFSGWIHLQFDEFLLSEKNRIEVRDLIQKATEQRKEDDPAARTGVLLVRLLDGQLTTDESSPLGYMVRSTRHLETPHYTAEDLRPLGDVHSYIRRCAHIFVRNQPASGLELANRMATDTFILGSRACHLFTEQGWWIVVADADWFGSHSEEALFTRILPYTEAGANSIRTEVLIGAFASCVWTATPTLDSTVKGTPSEMDLIRGLAKKLCLPLQWARAVAFKCEEPESVAPTN
ncbi:hypothetical protein BH09VER1_BH09VER1_41440 [soil metagenome]